MERKPRIKKRRITLLSWAESAHNFTNCTLLWTGFISRHYFIHWLMPNWFDSPTLHTKRKIQRRNKSERFHQKMVRSHPICGQH